MLLSSDPAGNRPVNEAPAPRPLRDGAAATPIDSCGATTVGTTTRTCSSCRNLSRRRPHGPFGDRLRSPRVRRAAVTVEDAVGAVQDPLNHKRRPGRMRVAGSSAGTRRRARPDSRRPEARTQAVRGAAAVSSWHVVWLPTGASACRVGVAAGPRPDGARWAEPGSASWAQAIHFADNLMRRSP